MSTVPYYSDAFTSDLRWVVLAIIGVFVLGFVILGFICLLVWVLEHLPRRKRPVYRELPQDHLVRIIVPYDQDQVLFDWAEWEERIKQ